MCTTPGPTSRRSGAGSEHVSAIAEGKTWLIQLLGLPKDALQIYLGLIIFLLSAALCRWPLRSWKPLATVAVAALLVEAWDIVDTARFGGSPLWARNWHHVWNTCFWPAVLFLLARYTGMLKR